MSITSITYPASGSDYTVTFPYLDRSHVKVSVDGEIVSYTWVNPSTVRITPTPTTGQYIQVYRETSHGVRLVDFTAPSILDETTLDTDSLQAFNMAQEALDVAKDAAAIVRDLGLGSVITGSLQTVNYTGDGTTTVYTLPMVVVGGSRAVLAVVDGSTQRTETYSVIGASLIFSEAPPVGALIDLRIIGVPADINLADDSVVTAIGGSTATALSNRFSHQLNVIDDFGAVGDGSTDDTLAFQTARDTALSIYVPAGTYSLTANVTAKFDIHPDASFNGVGIAIPSERGFFSDEGPVGLHRLRDRVWIGDAAIQNGKKSPASTRSWLGMSVGGYNTYLESRSQLCTVSSIGGVAGAFGSRASDNTRLDGSSNPENNTIGVASYVENDKTGAATGCWGTYIHAYRSSATTGSCHGLEVDVASVGTAPMVNPYTTQGMVSGVSAGLWVMAGGEAHLAGAPLTPNSLGFYLGNNGQRWDKGFVLATNAITRVDNADDSTAATAIQLARGHEIRWAFSASDAAISGYIRAIGNDAANIHGVQMSNSGVTLRGPGDKSVIQAQGVASAVNNHYFQNSATGGPLTWQAAGTDTNIQLRITPKGSEGLNLTTGAFLMNSSTVINSSRHPVLRAYTVATLPAAAGNTASLIYVSDGTSNKRLAVSDGTDWRWPDGAIVS